MISVGLSYAINAASVSPTTVQNPRLEERRGEADALTVSKGLPPPRPFPFSSAVFPCVADGVAVDVDVAAACVVDAVANVVAVVDCTGVTVDSENADDDCVSVWDSKVEVAMDGTNIEEDVGAIMVRLVVLRVIDDCIGVDIIVDIVVAEGMMVKLPILRVVNVVAAVVIVVVRTVDVVLVVCPNVISFPRQACIIRVPLSAKPSTELVDASTFAHAISTVSSIALIPVLQLVEQRSPAAKSATVQP